MTPDGNLQNHYMWVGTDGERFFVNIEVHRQKYQNVERDPRVALTIRVEQDPLPLRRGARRGGRGGEGPGTT